MYKTASGLFFRAKKSRYLNSATAISLSHNLVSNVSIKSLSLGIDTTTLLKLKSLSTINCNAIPKRKINSNQSF